MSYAREFANAVVLPNGQVFIVGGQSHGVVFSDSYAQLTPEIWDPVMNQFTRVLPHSTPRNCHSFALLLLNETMLSGGGGL
jgi:galactose oxidase